MKSPSYPHQPEISSIVWEEKYRYKTPDGTPKDVDLDGSKTRVVKGVYAKDMAHADEALEVMRHGYWIAGGRTMAGAGTKNRVTLINCFVNQEVDDSMEGIFDALKVAALSQQMGGGIGTSFGTIRPRGSVVNRTGSVSSGTLPFMDTFDAMAETVRSAGHRRAAMMATIPISHPDIREFITAKQHAGRLTNFNVSVLITDEFMRAVEHDSHWELTFPIPPASYTGPHRETYVYDVLPARMLWDEILRSTYTYAEPGIIFIDRVNQQNPLNYEENIQATNPCGEQPLPYNGNCNLGHVNLAYMVEEPFSNFAEVRWDVLRETVTRGVRFLDNVIDATSYPTQEQKNEGHLKRRLGLGYTGLGNMLQQLKLRYGSPEAIQMANSVGSFIANTAYQASAQLA